MTEANQEPKKEEKIEYPSGLPEAPATVNFFAVTQKGWNLQFTLRDFTEDNLIVRLAALTRRLEEIGATPKPVGQQPAPQPNAAAPVPPTPPEPVYVHTAPVAPSPVAPAVGATEGEYECFLVEVATAHSSQKPQLKFHCNGVVDPLKFTRSVEAMVTLLAPLGFTAGHIVVGQKYPAQCIVRWVMNGQYKDVVAVRAKPQGA